jgi:hypothetical protein
VCRPFFFTSYSRLNRPGLYSWHDPISCAICCAVCMSRDLRELSVTITRPLCYISINMNHPIVRPPHVPEPRARHPTTRSDHSRPVRREFTQPITAKYASITRVPRQPTTRSDHSRPVRREFTQPITAKYASITRVPRLHTRPPAPRYHLCILFIQIPYA